MLLILSVKCSEKKQVGKKKSLIKRQIMIKRKESRDGRDFLYGKGKNGLELMDTVKMEIKVNIVSIALISLQQFHQRI